MLHWVSARLVRRRFAEMSRGQHDPLLRLFANDAHFHYNGQHALAGDFHPKAEIQAWF